MKLVFILYSCFCHRMPLVIIIHKPTNSIDSDAHKYTESMVDFILLYDKCLVRNSGIYLREENEVSQFCIMSTDELKHKKLCHRIINENVTVI